MSIQRRVASELLPSLREYGGGTVRRASLGRCFREYWTAVLLVQHPSSPFPTEVKVALNYNGHHIGNPRDAHQLAKRGIVPELSDPAHTVCSVGKSHLDGKWYGWSHRCIFGFRSGDRVNPGDITAEHLEPGTVADGDSGARDFAVAYAKSVA